MLLNLPWSSPHVHVLPNANLPRCCPVVLAHFVFVDFDHREKQLIRYAYRQAETQKRDGHQLSIRFQNIPMEEPTSFRMLEDLVREESKAVNWTSSYS